MRTWTIAGLCAGLAVAPFATRAAEYVVYDAGGHPVGVLVPMAAAPVMQQPVGFPFAGLFAQQDAMLRQMIADMRSMQSAPMPALDINTMAPGSTVMISSFSDGRNSCSRTVTYRMQPGAAPVVNVSQTGDACGAMPTPGPQATVPAAERVAPTPVAPTAPGGTRLYQIDYRHPVKAPVEHRG